MLKELALHDVLAPVFARSKARVIKKQTDSNWRMGVALALIAANLVLLLAYVYGVNQYASQGYTIKVLQQKVAALTEQNQKINLQVSSANSMVGIQTDFLNANFVAAGTPKFLTVNQTRMAQAGNALARE